MSEINDINEAGPARSNELRHALKTYGKDYLMGFDCWAGSEASKMRQLYSIANNTWDKWTDSLYEMDELLDQVREATAYDDGSIPEIVDEKVRALENVLKLSDSTVDKILTLRGQIDERRSKREVGIAEIIHDKVTQLTSEALKATMKVDQFQAVVESLKSEALASTKRLQHENDGMQEVAESLKREKKDLQSTVESLKSEALATTEQLEQLKRVIDDLKTEALSSSASRVKSEEVRLDKKLYGAIELGGGVNSYRQVRGAGQVRIRADQPLCQVRRRA